MKTRDVILTGNSPPIQNNEAQVVDQAEDLSNKPKSRAETIQPLMSKEIWKPPNASDLTVVFEPFSSQLDPAEEATDLNAGLSQVLDTHANLRGVVLLSDGDWNIGNSPVEAATRFRMRGIPVFAVGVGSKVPLPDLELVSMDAPTFAVLKTSSFVFPLSFGVLWVRDRDVNVTLSIDKKPAISKLIHVPAMSQTQENMVWTPPAIGDYTLTMRIPRDTQELIPENNEISVPISVRKEQLKVLVVESYPRWEYRYLRNALERDPGVELTCLLFHPKLPKVGGGRSYIKNFPTTNELSRYDVVFLGDVGIGEKQLTLEQTRDLRQLVSAQASGLVFMPGRTGMHASLMSGSARGPLSRDFGRCNLVWCWIGNAGIFRAHAVGTTQFINSPRGDGGDQPAGVAHIAGLLLVYWGQTRQGGDRDFSRTRRNRDGFRTGAAYCNQNVWGG